MNLRHLSLFAVLALGTGACTGGSSADRATAADCNSQSNFCLHSCNLGCTVAGTCSVSEIAQNQPIELHFTDTIDPASVTAGAISLKTASGESPAGEFLVSGSSLIFVPQVRITGGVTRFGFRAGETYILNMRSDAQGDTLRSNSGDRLARNVICALSVTQGLVDLDGQPPQAELVVPAVTTDVGTDSQIVVRFSELIDLSQFQGGSTQVSPILYQIRKSIVDQNGQRICDPNFAPVLIGGVPVATVRATNPPTTEIALQPAIELPNQVCVEVTITEQVRDLSGRSAERRVFRFFTETGTPEPVTLTETFATEQRMDRIASGGTWAGGRAVPAKMGGSGRLGSFDPAVGQSIGGSTFLFNTDSQLFPATSTLFGDSIEVTDGVFEFTDLVVPSGTRVVFRGSKPAIIKVRGTCRIEGELSVNGAAPSSTFNGKASTAGPIGQVGPPVQGEPARPGGAGAGAGGRGGESSLGAGATAAMRGAPGEACVPVPTSGYVGTVAGSGGRGGDVFPASGNRANVIFSVFFSFSGMVSGGAGGGSFLGAGTAGEVLQIFQTNQADRGPGAAPGSTVPFQPLPGGLGALEHFLVGGSGGGGGGSHTVNMSSQDVNGNPPGVGGRKAWHAGGAGGGGGGALAVAVGHTFSVEGPGVVSSRGGGGAEHLTQNTGPPAPGGGGSGGSIVIQAEEASKIAQNGTIDVSGGVGTRITNVQVLVGSRMEARGGDGGHGFVRLEADGASAATLGIVSGPPSIPSASFADLPTAAEDTRSGFVSLWRSSRQLFPPTFLHYRLVARVNGQQVVYSDDPANFNPANRNDLPVRVYVQGGTVSPATNELDGTPGPWRDFVNGDGGRQSINSDNANGFRFMMIFNRDIETDVVVEEFEVTFEA